MVAIMIVTDKGKAYTMSSSIDAAVACIESLRNEKGRIDVKYIADREKRLQYLTKAFDVIEGGGENERRYKRV
jgi:hypothetical protein